MILDFAEKRLDGADFRGRGHGVGTDIGLNLREAPDDLGEGRPAAGTARRPGPPDGEARPPAPRTMEEIEKEAILRTLDEAGGNRTEAARRLGIGLRTLQRKLKEYKAQGDAQDRANLAPG